MSQVQAFACPGKAAGLGDGNKSIKVGEIHGRIPFGYPKYENYEFELFKHIPYDDRTSQGVIVTIAQGIETS
ncbi:hypothetical protein Pta6605_36690 [Pseudomonas amygdali pv. tabaci]|nr:hypothetical protein Pta6605_36690 [Pseudomonas amygdali pv. tabaci]